MGQDRRLLKQEGNYSEAITAYNKALQIDPYYVNAWDGIGWSLNGLGDYTQAISYLTKEYRYHWNLITRY